MSVLRALLRTPQYGIALLIYLWPWARSYRKRLLAITSTTASDRYWRPYFMAIWYRLKFARADPETQEQLKLQIIGSTAGVAWARSYDARSFACELDGQLGALSYREACPVFPALERLLEVGSDWTVVHIGSSSGREMAYYAERYRASQFIGIDIVPDVVQYASEAHRAANLRFMVADIRNMRSMLNVIIERPVIVLSHGTLQYLGPSFIGEWFQQMWAWPVISHLLINEGVSFAGQPPDELRGSVAISSWVTTHDYRWYAETAGWRTERCALIYPYRPPEAYPLHQHTAHYFYHGIRNG